MTDLDDADIIAAIAALSLAERRELAAELDHLARVQVEAPLAVARLWTHPAAEWDQRRAVIAALTGPLHVGIGGNRSGKTEGQLQSVPAVAMGRDHPHTQAWAELNGIPLHLIPEGPGEVVVMSQTASSSQAHTRPAVARYLPPGAEWYGMRSLGPAHVRIPVPGHRQEAVIRFASVDQGPRGVKGSQARMYLIDEEPEGEDGRLVLQECLRGASALGGVVTLAMTPQAGLTWVIEDLVQAGKYGAVTSRLNSLHNRFAPNYPALVRYLRSLDPQERRLRQEGVWYDRKGLIYPGWSRGLHYVDGLTLDGVTITCAADIPATWPRYRGLDLGQVDPTAVVWLAASPSGTLIAYRCRRQSGVPYTEWADRIHEAEGAVRDEYGRWVGHLEHASGSWHDPSDPSAADQLRLCDVVAWPADRRVEAGLSVVADALRTDGQGRAGLYVLRGDGTDDLVRELEDYRRDPASKTGKVRKVRDHLCDALRYAIMGAYQLEGLHGARPGLAETTEPEP